MNGQSEKTSRVNAPLTFHIASKKAGCHSLSLDCRDFRELFLKNRFEPVDDPAEASVIIIGACVVVPITENWTIDLVRKMRPHRDRGAVIIVTGCMTDQLKARISTVADCLFFSAAEVDRAREYFGFSATFDEGKGEDSFVFSFHGKVKYWQIVHEIMRWVHWATHTISPNAAVMLGRLLNTTYAYAPRAYLVRCARGCSNFCAYCAIRIARGRLKSRALDSIVNEVREALKMGCDHFVLVADDLSAYGLDLENLRLSQLLEAILGLGDSFTLEMHNLHPKHILSDLDRFLEVLSKRIRCIHFDFQSGSNRILKLMNREYTKEDVLFGATAILRKAPFISLRTDVIVGFPSEEEEDLTETMDVLLKIPFERVEVEFFVERPGASAVRLPGQIPLPVRKERQKRVRLFYYRKQLRRWMAGLTGKDSFF